MKFMHARMLLVFVALLTGGCGKQDANETAARELVRNKKKLGEIQQALKSASEQSATLTKKIDELNKEVAAMQGSEADGAK